MPRSAAVFKAALKFFFDISLDVISVLKKALHISSLLRSFRHACALKSLHSWSCPVSRAFPKVAQTSTADQLTFAREGTCFKATKSKPATPRRMAMAQQEPLSST